MGSNRQSSLRLQLIPLTNLFNHLSIQYADCKLVIYHSTAMAHLPMDTWEVILLLFLGRRSMEITQFSGPRMYRVEFLPVRLTFRGLSAWIMAVIPIFLISLIKIIRSPLQSSPYNLTIPTKHLICTTTMACLLISLKKCHGFLIKYRLISIGRLRWLQWLWAAWTSHQLH